LGHAIPALIFGNEPVHIYVGSYGNPAGSLKLKIGRLTAFLKITFLDWNLGVCQWKSTRAITFWQQLLFIIGGPVMSLIISIIAFVFLIEGGSDGRITLLSIVALSAFWDFLVNMIPWNRPVYLQGGQITYNDGTSLLQLLATHSRPDELNAAFIKMEAKEYASAQQDLEQLMEKGYDNKDLYYALIQTSVKQKKYEEALSYFKILKSKNHKLDGQDYYHIGHIYHHQNNFQEAQKFLDQSIYLEQANLPALFDRAKNEIMLGDYHLAIMDLNAILKSNVAYPGALATRAELFLKQDDLANAEDDISNALKINNLDHHTHFVAGLVFREKNENEVALVHFLKAQELGSGHHGLPFFIDQMRD